MSSPEILLPQLPKSSMNDVTLIKIAREIAMDIRPVQAILDTHEITPAQWAEISQMPQFTRYLRNFSEEWASANNTPERIRLKSLAMVEEALPEFYGRLHDPKEQLAAKTEVLKTVSRFAGVGVTNTSGAPAERFSVTINLGADRQVRIERDITPRGNEGDTA